MTSGGQLTWEEKRALVVYDKLQQEEYAKEKRRRALEVPILTHFFINTNIALSSPQTCNKLTQCIHTSSPPPPPPPTHTHTHSYPPPQISSHS